MSVLITFTPVMAIGSQESLVENKGIKQEIVSWVQSHKKSLTITGLAATGLKVAVTSILFCGIWNREVSGNSAGMECKDIKIGDLSGKTYKLSRPASRELADKHIIFYGGNGCPAENFVPDLNVLLDKGATIVAVSYRGFGESKLSFSRLRISESTVYNDGEEVYRYVEQSLKVKPSNIIILGFSLGGAVASHVAAKAAIDGKELAALILISPIDGVYNVASRATCRPLGAITRIFSASSLDTAKNLQTIALWKRNTPLYLCSGGPRDFLGFGHTGILQKARDFGFTTIAKGIASEAEHNDIDKILASGIDAFLELMVRN